MRRLTRDRETLAASSSSPVGHCFVIARRAAIPRHCEARSAVAIRVLMLQQNLSY
jgi:hypothetical protein